MIRLIVDDAAAARRTLREAGLSAEEHQVLTAFLPHSPGQLATVARSLADSDINIDAVYVLNSGADGIELAVVVDQPLRRFPICRSGAGSTGSDTPDSACGFFLTPTPP